MGCEYLVRLDADDGPVSNKRLEEVLAGLPHFFGMVAYPDGEAIQFRTPATLADTTSMPDVDVVAKGREILVCQYGDGLVAYQVLGAVVAEFVSNAAREHLEVLKP